MKIRLVERKISLENRIIDIRGLEIRDKIKDSDLERYYSEFSERLPEIEEYFEDRGAYRRAVYEVVVESPPKLIARERKTPFMWAYREKYSPFQFLLDPDKRRLNDELFVAPHMMVNFRENNVNDEDLRPLQREIRKRFEEYLGYKCVIEVPNDLDFAITKASVFHEGLHYVIARYQISTGRRFVTALINDKDKVKDMSDLERYQAEGILNERSVEILTDKLLSHDSDAQFENRWIGYNISSNFSNVLGIVSAITTGVILGTTILEAPYLLPLALVPGRMRDLALKKYKESKRKKILGKVEYPKFKI